MARHVPAFLDTAHPLQRHVPYAQHGASGNSGQNVYTSLRVQYQLAYARQPFHGYERRATPGDKLDAT